MKQENYIPIHQWLFTGIKSSIIWNLHIFYIPYFPMAVDWFMCFECKHFYWCTAAYLKLLSKNYSLSFYINSLCLLYLFCRQMSKWCCDVHSPASNFLCLSLVCWIVPSKLIRFNHKLLLFIWLIIWFIYDVCIYWTFYV